MRDRAWWQNQEVPEYLSLVESFYILFNFLFFVGCNSLPFLESPSGSATYYVQFYLWTMLSLPLCLTFTYNNNITRVRHSSPPENLLIFLSLCFYPCSKKTSKWMLCPLDFSLLLFLRITPGWGGIWPCTSRQYTSIHFQFITMYHDFIHEPGSSVFHPNRPMVWAEWKQTKTKVQSVGICADHPCCLCSLDLLEPNPKWSISTVCIICMYTGEWDLGVIVYVYFWHW